MFVKAIFILIGFEDIHKSTLRMFVNYYRSLKTLEMKLAFRSSGMQQTEKHNFISSLKWKQTLKGKGGGFNSQLKINIIVFLIFIYFFYFVYY